MNDVERKAVERICATWLVCGPRLLPADAEVIARELNKANLLATPEMLAAVDACRCIEQERRPYLASSNSPGELAAINVVRVLLARKAPERWRVVQWPAGVGAWQVCDGRRDDIITGSVAWFISEKDAREDAARRNAR